MEARTVIGDLEVRQLVYDDILDLFGCGVREAQVEGDEPFADMAGAPEGFHLAQFPCHAGFVCAGGPDGHQFREQGDEPTTLFGRDGAYSGCGSRENVCACRHNPVPLRKQERFTLAECRPAVRHGEMNASVGSNPKVDPPNGFAFNVHRNAVDEILTSMQHASIIT